MDTPRSASTTANVNKAFEASGLTRRELSDGSGIPYTTLYRLLNGHGSWTIEQIASVAKVLGVKPSRLVVFEETAA
jgi:predicted transcriptional regulator